MDLYAGKSAVETDQSLYALAALAVGFRRGLQEKLVSVGGFFIVFGARRGARIGHDVIRFVRVQADGVERLGARLIDAPFEIIQLGAAAISKRLFGVEAYGFVNLRYGGLQKARMQQRRAGQSVGAGVVCVE